MVVGGEKVNVLADESAPDYTDCVVGKVCEKGCLEAKKPILIKKEDQGDGSYEYECGLCSDIRDESDNPTFPFLYGDQCIT